MSTSGSSPLTKNILTEVEGRSYLPWLVWGLACSFYFYEFLLQVSPNVMGTELMHAFFTTARNLGILSGAYFYAYAGMQIPVGVLLDRYGPHRLLTIAAVICAISSILFGFTHHFYTAVAARFAIGIGSSFAAIGCMKLAANWFPNDRFALLVGIILTIGMTGAISGESPLALMVHHMGWRHSMLFLGLIGLILALLIMTIIKDFPDHRKPTPAQIAIKMPVWSGLKQILKDKQIWLVAIYGGLMYLPTLTLCGLWGSPFLVNKYTISRPAASAIISFVFVGWITGSALWGWISDSIGRRLPPMVIGAVGALLTLCILLYVPNVNLVTSEISLFFFGLFSSGFLPSFSIVKESCPSAYIATGLSFMNMMNMIGVAIAQPLVGKILDMVWNGEYAHGVRVYSLSNYQTALSITVVGIVIAILLLPFIKDTYCKSHD